MVFTYRLCVVVEALIILRKLNILSMAVGFTHIVYSMKQGILGVVKSTESRKPETNIGLYKLLL